MSRCGRTSQLEAVANGEAPLSLVAELRAHTKSCALCRHELNWLESEVSLFRQRAGRDEVAHLWSGVATRAGVEAAQGRQWSRVLVAMAAAVALVLGLGQLSPRPPSMRTAAEAQEALESDALMSPALFFDAQEPCSKLPSGVGFQCSQPVPASFLASR